MCVVAVVVLGIGCVHFPVGNGLKNGSVLGPYKSSCQCVQVEL
jgi:hypothetical protein